MRSGMWRKYPTSALISLLFLTIFPQIRAEEISATPGITYTNYRKPDIPWSIHVVRIERSRPDLELHTAHAGKAALGLGTLTGQINLYSTNYGLPVASVNGDFYQRDGPYAGAPHSLQVADRELISAPNGRAVFWLDPLGEPHATNISSLFQIRWPDGASTPFGLNENPRTNAVVLYTAGAGPSTHTTNALELVLELNRTSNKILHLGRIYSSRILEVHESGNSPLHPGQMVLSIRDDLVPKPLVKPGQDVIISTLTSPSLRGLKVAIGGGPVLLRDKVRQKLPVSTSETFAFTSMRERHPRSAIGWNQDAYFLVEVDGRQAGLSVGMTLEELATYMLGLGCRDAMNLDGGGSATLWYDGKVRNSPCDGHERPIANSLVISRKEIRRDSHHSE